MKKTLIAIGKFIVNRFDDDRRFLKFMGLITVILIALILLVSVRLISRHSSIQEIRAMTRNAYSWQT